MEEMLNKKKNKNLNYTVKFWTSEVERDWAGRKYL